MRGPAVGSQRRYSTGPSGVVLQRLFECWDIAGALRERLVQTPPGIPVGMRVARGKVELDFLRSPAAGETWRCNGMQPA